MKYCFTLLVSIIICGFVFAQAPMPTTAEYNGQKYPCYIMEYNLPPEETKAAFVNKLKSEGYNPDKSKGYVVYRNTRLKDLDPNEPQDVLLKFERKSRKEKDKSIVTLITAKSGSIPEEKAKGAKTAAAIEPSAKSVTFLNSFQSNINLSAYNLAVSNQQDVVDKAEKKLKNLQDDQSKMEKKIKNLQDDLAKNKKDQQNQIEEIAKQKSVLEQKKADKPVD